MKLDFLSRSVSLSRTAVLALVLPVMLAGGCRDDGDDVDQLSQVSGRVQGESSVPVAGATVTLAQVNSDGSLTLVSNAPVVTDALGRFTVETSLNNAENLIVIAEKGSDEWRALVTGEARFGDDVLVAPLDDETTAEANIFANLVAMGEADVVSIADITAYVDATLGDLVVADEAATEQIAEALVSDAEVFSTIMLDPMFGLTETEIETIQAARLAARYDLDRALFAANGDAEAIENAWEDYREAEIEAFADVGIDVEMFARMREAAIRALLSDATTLSPEIQLALARNTSDLRAHLITQALQSSWVAFSPSSKQMELLLDAGTTLRADLLDADNIPSLRDAYDDYHDAIVDQLQLVLPGGLAASVVPADEAITTGAGPLPTLEEALDDASNASELVNAYTAYYEAVRDVVESYMSSATPAQLDAVTEALIFANIDF